MEMDWKDMQIYKIEINYEKSCSRLFSEWLWSTILVKLKALILKGLEQDPKTNIVLNIFLNF